MEEWQTYCPQCQRVTLGRKDTPNHLLHFLISFFTCGLWAIVWLGLTLTSSWRPYLCTLCGSPGQNR